MTNARTAPIVIWDSHALNLAAQIGFTVGAIGLAVAALVELVRRYRAAGPPLRRTLTPVYAMFVGALVFLIAGNGLDAVSDRASIALGRVAVVFIALVPVAFLVGLLRSRLARGSVVQLLMSLDEGTPLRDALSAALGDPSLEIAYWLGSRDRWVDADGRVVPEPADAGRRSVTMVERNGEQVAALVHDASLDDEPDLVHGVAAAAALSLQTQRLQAELRNQYEFVITLVNTAPSLLITVDPEGRILNQNLAVLEASGYEDEELVRGRHFWDVFIDPDQRDELRERFENAAPEFPPSEYENAFTNVRGEQRVIAWRTAPVVDESGDVVSIVAGGIDITERKRQEVELRASEERLRAVIQSAPVAIVEVDLDNRVITWNPAAELIYGWTAEEITGDRVPIIADHEEESRELDRSIRAGATFSGIETRRRRKDGTDVDVEVSAAPVRDADGNAVGLMGLYMDVTERRRHEEAVRAERDFLVTVSRATPSLLAIVGPDGRVDEERGVNMAFADVMGFTDDLAKGRYFWDLVAAPGEEGPFRETVLEAIALASPLERESTWLSRDRVPHEVAWTCRPLADVHGRDIHLICGTDITERKLRELDLQRERDITETLMQAIPSLVVVVDSEAIIVDSGVDETRAGVNEAFRQALGWPDAALVHRSVLELIDEGDAYLARMAIASAANGVASGERESNWLRSDGERLAIAWTATPVADVTRRKASLVLLSGVDVTERKRQEEEVRASRARIVQTADETRRKLERNLHDGAQQRLVALSVSLRLAETKLRSDPGAAGTILNAARDELAHALEELRELARGIHPAILTDRGLAAAIEALVTRTPLAVEVELPAERLPPAVEAALYYVVSESLTNVVKYAGASRASVRVELNGEGVVTADVADDGVGGADAAKGSGLRGLVDRVEALDGRLTVDSPAGRGTRVHVEVPIPAPH